MGIIFFWLYNGKKYAINNNSQNTSRATEMEYTKGAAACEKGVLKVSTELYRVHSISQFIIEYYFSLIYHITCIENYPNFWTYATLNHTKGMKEVMLDEQVKRLEWISKLIFIKLTHILKFIFLSCQALLDDNIYLILFFCLIRKGQ